MIIAIPTAGEDHLKVSTGDFGVRLQIGASNVAELEDEGVEALVALLHRHLATE